MIGKSQITQEKMDKAIGMLARYNGWHYDNHGSAVGTVTKVEPSKYRYNSVNVHIEDTRTEADIRSGSMSEFTVSDDVFLRALDGEVIKADRLLSTGTELSLSKPQESNRHLESIYLEGILDFGKFTHLGEHYTLIDAARKALEIRAKHEGVKGGVLEWLQTEVDGRNQLAEDDDREPNHTIANSYDEIADDFFSVNPPHIIGVGRTEVDGDTRGKLAEALTEAFRWIIEEGTGTAEF